jgi:hypothetical protein
MMQVIQTYLARHSRYQWAPGQKTCESPTNSFPCLHNCASLISHIYLLNNISRTLRLVGMYFRIAMEMAVSVMGSKPMQTFGWPKLELEVFLAHCRAALRDTSVHSYVCYFFWVGQKPSL